MMFVWCVIMMFVVCDHDVCDVIMMFVVCDHDVCVVCDHDDHDVCGV